jgi:hypothetical protein
VRAGSGEKESGSSGSRGEVVISVAAAEAWARRSCHKHRVDCWVSRLLYSQHAFHRVKYRQPTRMRSASVRQRQLSSACAMTGRFCKKERGGRRGGGGTR